MKTRNGFVSNSSSSSFVIIGRELSGFMEVLSLTEEERAKVTVIAKNSYDYTEMDTLDEVLFNEMQEYEPWEINQEFEFWLAQFSGGDWKQELTEEIILPATVYGGEGSHHTSWIAGSPVEDWGSFHNYMHERGYGDQTSEEEKRMEELL